jgi:hypothetical protein
MTFEEEKDLLISKELMGHSNTESTLWYAKAREDRIEKVSHRVQDKLLSDEKIIPLEREVK